MNPGWSQQAVAHLLGTPPSPLVALVDGLEQRGLIERRRNPGDRRNYALHLTAAGEQAMTDLSQASLEHEQAISAPLTEAERAQLSKLLGKLAAAHGLVPGIHPGYRNLPRPRSPGRDRPLRGRPPPPPPHPYPPPPPPYYQVPPSFAVVLPPPLSPVNGRVPAARVSWPGPGGPGDRAAACRR